MRLVWTTAQNDPSILKFPDPGRTIEQCTEHTNVLVTRNVECHPMHPGVESLVAFLIEYPHQWQRKVRHVWRSDALTVLFDACLACPLFA